MVERIYLFAANLQKHFFELLIFKWCNSFFKIVNLDVHVETCAHAINSLVNNIYIGYIVSSPPWDQGEGNDFCVISQAGGRLLNFKSHIQGGKMILSSQAEGELLYHDELFVFPQNASPWILQILPAALSYIFLTFS